MCIYKDGVHIIICNVKVIIIIKSIYVTAEREIIGKHQRKKTY
jgi:hypothetical protein